MMKKNLATKIIAVAIALLIWLQLTLTSNHLSWVKLQLNLVNATQEDSLLISPGKISCQVQGRGLDIIKLSTSKAFIEMAAADLIAGNEKNFALRDYPPNLQVSVLSVDPGSVLDPAASLVGASGDIDAARRRQDTGTETSPGTELQDPVQLVVLPNVPIAADPKLKLFPSYATLKVQGRASLLASLPRGVTVTASENPDARGLFSLNAQLPEGVTLVDISPRQVRVAR